MLTLPNYEYEVFRYESFSVNKYELIMLDTCKYGLSPELYGKTIQAKIYFDKIEIYHDRCLLKTFQRSYDKNTEVYDWRDYLPALVKKPGATEHTKFFNQFPKLWQEYLKSVRGRERKSALTLLSEIVTDGNACICDDIMEMANECGNLDVDNIRQYYLWCSKPENHPKPMELSSNPPVLNYQPDLSAYDELTTTGGDYV